MKKYVTLCIIAMAFALSFPLSTEAKTTKHPVSTKTSTLDEINYKYNRLVQLDYARHNEVMGELRAIRERLDQLNKKVAETPAVSVPTATPSAEALPSTAAAGGQAATSVPGTHPTAKPPTPPAVLPQPTAGYFSTTSTPVAPTASPKPSPEPVIPPKASAPTPPPPRGTAPAANTPAVPSGEGRSQRQAPEKAVSSTQPPKPKAAPAPIIFPQPVIVTVPKNVNAAVSPGLAQGIRSSKSLAFIALLIALASLGSIAYLIVAVQKSNQRIRRMLWKSEVDHPRNEVVGGRPQLKVEKNFDRLLLTNTGTVSADDIRLSLGPAPATMKQRLRVLAQIAGGEKAEVDIGNQTLEGQLYGTLEYKNPENGRIYKDQFVLKVDTVTGEINPVQHAS